ncbi:ATP-grasp fold, RimK-type [uncultured Caudovirales phage]|uniref:ATP-grasp fold, RimK-type n=1 Tax=uncultured Caudovirales phage TaxID=2100421 RepID=A0A6J5LHJ7_9CAUD|nr:ATP-grasp fold, RimK-type [uncultured Caudovirales phage]
MKKKKPPQLLCTEKTLGSKSLREIAHGLSAHFQRKVFRTTKPHPLRKQFRYGQSVNKIQQYDWFKANNIPALEYTTDCHVARQWLDEGHTVFGRKYLNASCGKGIVVLEPGDVDSTLESFAHLPVFTKYKKKKREFRVHVFKQNVVAVVEKKRRREFNGERDTKIRNLANGYVFIQGVVDEPPGLRELAVSAATVSPSDFRGVDIGFNERNNELFVIEVNSAPGIQGTNVSKYLNAIVATV